MVLRSTVTESLWHAWYLVLPSPLANNPSFATFASPYLPHCAVIPIRSFISDQIHCHDDIFDYVDIHATAFHIVSMSSLSALPRSLAHSLHSSLGQYGTTWAAIALAASPSGRRADHCCMCPSLIKELQSHRLDILAQDDLATARLRSSRHDRHCWRPQERISWISPSLSNCKRHRRWSEEHHGSCIRTTVALCTASVSFPLAVGTRQERKSELQQ